MPRTSLKAHEVQAFRERICQAATHLFAENGYGAVTLRAIAAEVGCSPMTPYRYFRGKEEIFALVKAAGFARFADVQEQAVRGLEDPAERLAALGVSYVEFALSEPDAYRIMFELEQDSAIDHPELLREGLRAWLPLRDGVAYAIERGLLAGDADTVAHVFWAGVHGLVSLHLAGKLRIGPGIGELVGPTLCALLEGNLAEGARPDGTWEKRLRRHSEKIERIEREKTGTGKEMRR
jgi:AcrR family transcriptional regulator